MIARAVLVLFAIASVASGCGAGGPSLGASAVAPAPTTAPPTADPLAAVRADLAPTGTLRVALVGTPPLVAMADAGGRIKGLGVDVAASLSQRLGTQMSTELFASPPEALSASDRWDILFVPSNSGPAAPATLAYAGPYVLVPHTYLVLDPSIHASADLDKATITIGVEPAHAAQVRAQLADAHIVVVSDSSQGFAMLKAGSISAFADSKVNLLEHVATVPSAHVIDDAFFTAQLSIAIAKSRTAGLSWLTKEIGSLRSSGELQKLVDATGRHGLVVPTGP